MTRRTQAAQTARPSVAAPPARRSEGHALLNLQRSAGNKVVTSLVEGGGTGHLAAPLTRGLHRPERATGDTASGAVVQRVAPPLAAGVGAAISALTLPEAVSIAGTIIGTAVTVGGLMAESHNGSTNVGPDAVLRPEAGTDMIVSTSTRNYLAQVTRTLYLSEMENMIQERLDAGTDVTEEVKQELKVTAGGNVQAYLAAELNAALRTSTGNYAQNGDGSRDKDEEPWGEVTIRVRSGYWSMPYAYRRVAARHGVTIPAGFAMFFKEVKLSFEVKKEENLLSGDDDIFVRAMSLAASEDDDGDITAHAEVAFDWDGDTTRYEWDAERPIDIYGPSFPHWRGARDPDD